jgi:hypothetical protein
MTAVSADSHASPTGRGRKATHTIGTNSGGGNLDNEGGRTR